MIVVDDFRTLKTSEPEKCTYVIEFKDCIKIGYAKNIYDRCKKLKAENKNILRVAILNCDNNNRIEKEMHFIFSDRKIKGEYFNVSFDVAIVELLNLKSKTQFKEEIFLLCTKFENYVEFQKKNLKIPRCAIFKEFEIWMDDYMQICSRRNYSFKLKFVEKVKDLLK